MIWDRFCVVWLRLVGSRPSPALLAQCNEMLLGCLSHGWCKMEEEEGIKMVSREYMYIL